MLHHGLVVWKWNWLALAAWPAGVCKLLAEAPILAVAPTLSYLAWAAWPAGVYKPLAVAPTLAMEPTLSYLACAAWPAGVYRQPGTRIGTPIPEPVAWNQRTSWKTQPTSVQTNIDL